MPYSRVSSKAKTVLLGPWTSCSGIGANAAHIGYVMAVAVTSAVVILLVEKTQFSDTYSLAVYVSHRALLCVIEFSVLWDADAAKKEFRLRGCTLRLLLSTATCPRACFPFPLLIPLKEFLRHATDVPLGTRTRSDRCNETRVH